MNQFDLLSAGSWKVGLTALAALFGYNSQLWDLFGTGIGIRIPEPCSPFTISIVITQLQLHTGSSNMPKAVVDNFFVFVYLNLLRRLATTIRKP